jgi:hypothetical protein
MTSVVKPGVYVIGDKRNDPNRKMVGPKEIEAAIKNVAQHMRGEKYDCKRRDGNGGC